MPIPGAAPVLAVGGGYFAREWMKSIGTKVGTVLFVVEDDKPIVVTNADRYGNGGNALFWMVRHYLKHPESRGELSDGRALDQLRDDAFEAG